MFEFLPIKADIKNNLFENTKYLPFVLELLFKNKRLLIDDYFPQDDDELLDFLIEEINSVYPWFVVGVLDGEPMGTAWITHWHGGMGKYHSCQLHACIDKKFWGESSLLAMDELICFIVGKTGVKRIQTEIPQNNFRAVEYAKRAGFFEEGMLECATLKNGLPVNHILLAKIL